MPLRLTTMLVCAMLLGPGAPAAEQSPLTADEGAVYERLTRRLIAPCCWKESVAAHRSPAADEVKAAIQERLQAGQGEEEIAAAMVKQYGERVLIVPEGSKADLLFRLPYVALVIGLIFAALHIRKLRRRRKVAPAVGSPYEVEIDDSELGW